MKKIIFLGFILISCGGSSGEGVTSSVEQPASTEEQETTTTTVQDTTTTTVQDTTTTTLQPDGVLSEIKNMMVRGVSPHMEVVDSSTLRIFYSSLDVMGLAVDLCDYELNCIRQGVVNRVQDLTLITTVDGVRRGYYVELNPNTKSKEIYTAIFSEDGLTYSESKSLGFNDGGSMAWGVPDSVLLPDGRVRLYWVAESTGMRGEKIVSATSDSPKGIKFTKDPGYRLENGYVDFEVLRAEENNWEAVFSYSPEGLPRIPQSIFYGTSKDGLTWEFTGNAISPTNMSYLDPTGILLDNGTYLLISSVAPNELGDRDYILYSMVLTTP